MSTAIGILGITTGLLVCFLAGMYLDWCDHRRYCACKQCRAYRASMREEGKEPEERTQP